MYIPSFHDNEAKRLLKEFLEGRRSLSEIQEKLHDRLEIDFHLAPVDRKIVRSELDSEAIQITVTEHHLLQMLQRYLNGEVSDLELSNWAAFIYMLPVYVPEGDTDDDRWEAGGDLMWNIIQELVTPQLFDGLRADVVRRYMDSLT